MCMVRTPGFLTMVSDFFKPFFHTKVADKALHNFPLGFKRTPGRKSPNEKIDTYQCRKLLAVTKRQNTGVCGCRCRWEEHELFEKIW